MAAKQDRLPGIGAGRRRIGRHRRALDTYLRAARRVDTSPEFEHMASIVRGLADDVDLAEFDDDVSAWVVANTLSQYRTAALDLYRLAPLGDPDDPLDRLDDDLDAILSGAPLRNPATS